MLRRVALIAVLTALGASIAAFQGGLGPPPQGGGGAGRGVQGRGVPPPGRGGPVTPPRTTPLFRCGLDAVVGAEIPVNWFTIALAADSRLYMPCPGGLHTDNHREVRDAKVLANASSNPIPEMRRLAIAAYGRLGRPEFVGVSAAPGVLIRALADQYAPIRREAVSAIADALSGAAVEPDDTGPHPPRPEQIQFARASFEQLLATEKDDDVAAMIFETLGRLKYTDDATRDAVESVLVAYSNGTPVRQLGVAKGLEALIRANARRPIQSATRDLLRMLATAGHPLTPVPTMTSAGSAEVPGDAARLARVRRLAMQSLETARDDDLDTVQRAAQDADWQVRRFAARRMDSQRPEMAATLVQLRSDRAFQVRYEIVGIDARTAMRTKDCSGVLKAVDDPAPLVAMRALDSLQPGCLPVEEVDARLRVLALQVGRSGENWLLPRHAVMALQRLKLATEMLPDVLAGMVTHGSWQVRAAGATLAGQIGDIRTARRLAADRDANVRTAALQALVNDKSDETIDAQINALQNSDHQLVMTAARVMEGTPARRREEVVFALLAAFTRLTERAADTSRDPRVAIVQRLQQLMSPELADRLTPMGEDFDPKVRAAAATAYRALMQTPMPVPSAGQRRYPLLPTLDQTQALPTRAIIQMQRGGTIELELLTSQAPVSVARFVELVKARYYHGLTFHRVVPNFVVQGGSPGANEYVGDHRYWRDEPSTEPHTRGAVGISTRGRDTGDGQIFIDLIDLPRLDHDYTVFARVISGLDVVDRITEGAAISGDHAAVRTDAGSKDPASIRSGLHSIVKQ